MTEFIKTNFTCRICGNGEENLEFLTREMLFGTKKEFKYIECSKCKCIQIKEIPENLQQYYPKNYNAFSPNIKLKDNIIKRYFKKLLAKKYLTDDMNFLTRFLESKFGLSFLIKIKPAKVNFNTKILDIGSGNGRRLVGLARYGFNNITGIDPFIEKDFYYGNGVKIFKSNVLDFTGKFEMIMLNHSFEHMTNPIEILNKIKSLLTDDGILLIRIPVSNSYAWKKYGADWVDLDPPRHIYLYNTDTIKLLAEKTGFKLIHVLYDSSEYQFVGSEQYLKDIPMHSEKSYYNNKANSIFDKKQINFFLREAERLNNLRQGDTACFYLIKS